MSASWLRRNAAPVAVVAVAAPALTFVLIGLPTLDNVNSEPRFESASQGDTVSVGGYDLTLTTSQEFVGLGTGSDGNDIPVGSSLVAAIVEFDTRASGASGDSYCTTELTSRVGGTERRWAEVSNVARFGYEAGEDTTSFCTPDGEPFSLEVVFLTPTGTYDEATLDIRLDDDYVRFELVH